MIREPSPLLALVAAAATRTGIGGFVSWIAEDLHAACALLTFDEARAAFQLAAFSASVSARWAPDLDGPILPTAPGLAAAFFLAEPQVIASQSWPVPDAPAASVLLIPITAGDHTVGVMVVLRTAAAFRPEEQRAAEALSPRLASELQALGQRPPNAELRPPELPLGTLRAFRGQSADACLHLFAVQLRHKLAARSVAILEATGRDSLVVAAGAGQVELAVGQQVHGPLDLDDEALTRLFGAAPGGCKLVVPVTTPRGEGRVAVRWATSSPPTTEARILCTQAAELASHLLGRSDLLRNSLESLAGQRLASELARHRDAFARQVVHDLRNSLHSMGLLVEDIELAAANPERVRRSTAALDRTLGFMATYLKDTIRSLDRNHPLEAVSEADLPAAFDRVISAVARRIRCMGRQLRVLPPPAVVLRTSSLQLDQILELMVVEAAERASKGTTLEIWAAIAGGWAALYVQGEGPPCSLGAPTDPIGAAQPPADRLAALEALVAAAGGRLGLRGLCGDPVRLHVGLPTIAWGSPQFDADGKDAREA